MKRAIVIIGLVVIMACGSVNALESKDFYSDGNIMPGEQWNAVSIYDTPPAHTTVNMSGGDVAMMITYDASIFNMTDGRIDHLYSYEYSTANISGGLFDGLTAWEHSFIAFSGTSEVLYDAAVFGTARIDVSGGIINGLNALNEGVINIYAGDITYVWAQDNTIVNVFGHHDLMKISSGGMFGYGFVQGYYNDLSWFRFDLENAEAYSHVNLIPEPVTILLLGVGGLFLRKKS